MLMCPGEFTIMVKRMLVDASHTEETRVVVANGTRLEEFDFESLERKQLKGNIYLAKVMRVEPSLQAAFVDYGGNRHGFLPFSEIHPDYYQIPVEDREALFLEQEKESGIDDNDEIEENNIENSVVDDNSITYKKEEQNISDSSQIGAKDKREIIEDAEFVDTSNKINVALKSSNEKITESSNENHQTRNKHSKRNDVEEIGGDEIDDIDIRRSHASRSLLGRRYKIQEVIKKRQILLVQVVKEERGNKGAALTTYLSLAGRYCVLMPNAVRGGGISRKITSQEDRKRLKTILAELNVPARMGVIVRTAGTARSKAEIRRDFEYLTRQWEKIREQTLNSIAPDLIYEEGNLIKRSIRDLYTRDVDEILVDGDEGYRVAKDFMRMLIPSHTSKVQPYRDRIPLFARYQIESQLDTMYSPEVKLRSGGYLVINSTEALVAIDVNSGRATKERNVEETALKTNLEAAGEVARQLRLRDLAGLIVVDFIDMEGPRNQRAVERKLKEAMRIDRARIQIGRISPFGLLELSRQRLRPSLSEASMVTCSSCSGTGIVRSIGSSAVHVLRAIEEEGLRNKSPSISVSLPAQVAYYILNNKRKELADIEEICGFKVTFINEPSMVPPMYNITRSKVLPVNSGELDKQIQDNQQDKLDSSEATHEKIKRRRRRRKPRKEENLKEENNNIKSEDKKINPLKSTVSDSSPENEEPKYKNRIRNKGRHDKKPRAKSDNTDPVDYKDTSLSETNSEIKKKDSENTNNSETITSNIDDSEAVSKVENIKPQENKNKPESKAKIKTPKPARKKNEDKSKKKIKPVMNKEKKPRNSSTKIIKKPASQEGQETKTNEDSPIKANNEPARKGWWQRKNSD